MHLAQCTLFYIKCCSSVLSICPLLYFKYFNFSTERKKTQTKTTDFFLECDTASHSFFCGHLWFLLDLSLQSLSPKFPTGIFSWVFFPVETSLQKRVANQLILTSKHINSSFTMAFILLCQKRDKLLICHQPVLLPKLPFTIGKLFTILESLPLCNSPAYSGWESSCRLFAISAGLDFVIFVAYIIEYVTTDCQVFTFYLFMILIQPHA